MDYGFTTEEVLMIHLALRRHIEHLESLQNSKENRRQIMEFRSLLQKLESLDPNLRLLALAKKKYSAPSP